MGLTKNLFRRGAVYWWRGRITNIDDKKGSRTIAFSLGIHDPARAKVLGAALTARIEAMRMRGDFRMLSSEVTTRLLQTMLVDERAKLDRDRRADIYHTGDAMAGFGDDLAFAWAYAVIGELGIPHARVSSDYVDLMRADGLPDDFVRRVYSVVDDILSSESTTIPGWRRHAAKPKHYKDALKKAGIDPEPNVIEEAERLDYLARSQARFESARLRTTFVRDRPNEAELMAKIAADTNHDSPDTAASSATYVDDKVEQPVGRPEPGAASYPPQQPPTFGGNAAAHPNPSASAFVDPDEVIVEDDIATIAAEICARKLSNKKLDKTERQARMIFDLFGRFLQEGFGIKEFARIKPGHLKKFDDFLRNLPTNYGKSPGDKSKPVSELMPPTGDTVGNDRTERGLSLGTRQRHWRNLSQLFEKARLAGLKVDDKLKPNGYTTGEASERGREKRAFPTAENFQIFLTSSVFHGCKAWHDLHSPGEEFYHRAAFFVPLMLYYMGMRREEACGLAIDDFMTSESGLPFIRLRPNDFRPLKNSPSKRDLPIHPELLRLRLLEYRDALAALGYTRLFPDLFSATSKSSLGDKLYKELEPVLEASGLDFHKSRHNFITKLEECGVSLKVIKDLVGHAGDDVTTEIYTNDAGLQRKLAAISLLPNITSALDAAEIRLLPWVVDKRPMPGTKGARTAAQFS